MGSKMKQDELFKYIKRIAILAGIFWLGMFAMGNLVTFSIDLSADTCGDKSINYIFLNFRCMYLFGNFVPELDICKEWAVPGLEGVFKRGDCSRIDDEYGMCYFDGQNIYLEDGSLLGGTGRCSKWRERTECEKSNPSYIFEHALKKVYYDNGIALEYNNTNIGSIDISGAKVIKEEGGETCRKKTVKDLTCSELIYELKCYGKPHKVCPNILVNKFNTVPRGYDNQVMAEYLERCIK